MLVSSILAALAIIATPLTTASPVNGTSNDVSQPVGIACGRATCVGDQVCCNPTCSMCTAPDTMYTMQDCGHLENPPTFTKPPIVVVPGPRPSSSRVLTKPKPTKPVTYAPPEPTGGVACGKNKCSVDEVCCNSSCGICTPPDGACIMMFCVDGHLPETSAAS